ncbi:DsbA family protein [Paenibacillus pasadenensis]|uniref:Periplasmic thiol:disulfide interchange protein DsbA n=1 Tax=Paenibacillus pasadenensis TaxID=217090 RepID=A0A2N5N567_9BACL|nr:MULTISPECIES: thioredoxin domain-containing protein [Paenibacillus]PLT45504.1 Periplasmic thiol:disulfide interchange protein DsbA [Paenibacillus pasadenensis]
MSQSKSSKKKKNVYVPPAKQKKGNGALIWLTIAIAFIAVVIILGINNSSKPHAFNYGEMPRLGDENAQVKLVEFGDYKCPSCKLFSEQVKPLLVQDYINDGKAALYFANYAFLGQDSVTAAVAAHSVYLQDPEQFWAYNDAIYANQGDETTVWATPERLVQIAKDAKLDIDFDKLLSDINAGVGSDKVAEESRLAESTLKVGGTPSLFVDGEQLQFKGYDDIKKAIDAKLDEKK